MLYIIHEDENEGVEWHISSRELRRCGVDPSKVSFVQADGHELELILDTFEGIPKAMSSVQRWYGDHAKFIAGNLYSK